jgi:hypothetical protein
MILRRSFKAILIASTPVVLAGMDRKSNLRRCRAPAAAQSGWLDPAPVWTWTSGVGVVMIAGCVGVAVARARRGQSGSGRGPGSLTSFLTPPDKRW